MAYTQILTYPLDIPKSAIETPFGLFEFPYMTFGLRNAGQTLQRFVDGMLLGLDFCFAYLDYILVFSPDHQQKPCSNDLPIILINVQSIVLGAE